MKEGQKEKKSFRSPWQERKKNTRNFVLYDSYEINAVPFTEERLYWQKQQQQQNWAIQQ